jgi:monoterpene epsilon-lactone hydrolase
MRVLQKAVVTLTQWTDKREPDIARSRKGVDVVEGFFRLARGVTIAEETTAGLPVRRYSSGGHTPGVLLHLHGGAYYCGTSKMGRCYSRIVADGGPDMVSLDYRLAPEHPYPAALDDALAAYEALLTSGPVVVMGDSAGGGLAFALVQRLRDEGKRLPVAMAPFFPWSDLTQSSESYSRTAGHDMMTKRGGDWAAGLYAAGQDLRTPGISPLFGSFIDFPPTLITVGTGDALLDEAREVTAKLTQAGVDVTLRETAGGIHGFTTIPSPEARAAIAFASRFIRQQLHRSGG